jgi:chromate transporter
VGFKIRRWYGALAAVLGMLIPAFLSMLALSEFYLHFHEIPAMESVFAGMSPAIVAFILFSTWKLGKSVLKSAWDWPLAAFAFLGLTFLNLGVVLTVLVAGLAGMIGSRIPAHKGTLACLAWPLLLGAGVPLLAVGSHYLWPLFYSFLKVGAFTFGGGYVMVPLLEAEYVHKFQWLTHREFADSVAMGQITPGPIIITATFIGYKVAGLAGACLATLAVFFPSYLITAVVSFYYQHFKANRTLQSFLRGVSPCVVGMLMAAIYSLGRVSLQSGWGVFIVLVTLLLAFRTNINSIWILFVAGFIGWIVGR